MRVTNASPLNVYPWVVNEGEVTFGDISYRKGKPSGACVHTLRVHVGSEEHYFTVLISVRFQTLEKCLSILQNDRRRFEGEWTICEWLIRPGFLRESGCSSTHTGRSSVFPSRQRRSTG